MTTRRVYEDAADVLEALPALVLVHRRRNGLSQRQAAEQMGIDASTLCRMESGVGMPGVPNTVKVLRWLAEGS